MKNIKKFTQFNEEFFGFSPYPSNRIGEEGEEVNDDSEVHDDDSEVHDDDSEVVDDYPEFMDTNTDTDSKCEPCSISKFDDFEQVKDWNDNNSPKPWQGHFEAKKSKGKTPKTEKEKELAKKYPPKDKITRGDFIAAAIENKKKGGKNEDEKSSKKDEKKPKFGSKEWQEKYGKKK